MPVALLQVGKRLPFLVPLSRTGVKGMVLSRHNHRPWTGYLFPYPGAPGEQLGARDNEDPKSAAAPKAVLKQPKLFLAVVVSAG